MTMRLEKARTQHLTEVVIHAKHADRVPWVGRGLPSNRTP